MPLEDEDDSVEPLRAALDQQVSKYVADRFQSGASSVFLTEQDEDTKAFAVCINSTITKPSSYWFVPFHIH